MTPLFDWVEKVCFCAVVVDKLIYAIGRVMLKDTHSYGKRVMYRRNLLSHSSTFDTEGNEWKEIALLKEARTGARGVCKNGDIIIAGVHGIGPGWLNSCEVYNIATNEWQFIASLTMPRVNGKMVLID